MSRGVARGVKVVHEGASVYLGQGERSVHDASVAYEEVEGGMGVRGSKGRDGGQVLQRVNLVCSSCTAAAEGALHSSPSGRRIRRRPWRKRLTRATGEASVPYKNAAKQSCLGGGWGTLYGSDCLLPLVGAAGGDNDRP